MTLSNNPVDPYFLSLETLKIRAIRINEKEWKVPAPPKIKLLKTLCLIENKTFEKSVFHRKYFVWKLSFSPKIFAWKIVISAFHNQTILTLAICYFSCYFWVCPNKCPKRCLRRRLLKHENRAFLTLSSQSFFPAKKMWLIIFPFVHLDPFLSPPIS